MGMRESFNYLTLDEEKQEARRVMNSRIIKLKYNGVQKFPGQQDLKLWTILTDCFHNGYNFKFSTRSLDGLKDLGVL